MHFRYLLEYTESHYYPLVCMRSKGYCNLSVCLLVCLWTSYLSLVSGFITCYVGQLGFERYRIDAILNGFSRVSLVAKKKAKENFGSLLCPRSRCYLQTYQPSSNHTVKYIILFMPLNKQYFTVSSGNIYRPPLKPTSNLLLIWTLCHCLGFNLKIILKRIN